MYNSYLCSRPKCISMLCCVNRYEINDNRSLLTGLQSSLSISYTRTVKDINIIINASSRQTDSFNFN